MVCSDEVVVYRFRHAHDAHFIADAVHILRELGNGIHRVVSADIEEIAYIIIAENIENLLIYYEVVSRHILWELLAAGAERGCRRIFKQGKVVFSFYNVVQKAEASVKHALYSVYRTVDFIYLVAFESAAYNARKRSVDSRGGTAGLTYDGIAVKFYHIDYLFLTINF